MNQKTTKQIEYEIYKSLVWHTEAKECYTGEDLKYFFKLNCPLSIYNKESYLQDVDFSKILKRLER